MSAAVSNKLSHTSLQQAAHWYVQLHDQQVGEQERLRWQAWLDQSGEHQDAWRYVQRVGERFAPLHGDGESQAASLALRGGGRSRVKLSVPTHISACARSGLGALRKDLGGLLLQATYQVPRHVLHCHACVSVEIPIW